MRADEPSYPVSSRDDGERAPVGPGVAFLWIALLVNLAWFSAFAVSTGGGILHAIAQPSPPIPSDLAVRSGGAQWVIMEVVGPVILGLVMAYAAYRYYTRNRRLDRKVKVYSNVVYEVPPSERA